MERLLYLLVLTLVCALPAGASEVLEDFSSVSHLESGTAIWNQALGKIHPHLQVVNYEGLGTPPPIPFSVGDGSQGVFDLSTYAQFSVNGDLSGNKIRFDTARFPILQVTSFHLAPGWVIEPVGNAPLIIYSLSTVRIEGEIWCQGHDGTSPSGASPGTGGAGRCGGTAGGDGGAIGQNGHDGVNVSASVTAGQGGFYHSDPVSVGGGGGGALNGTTTANNGPNSGGGANGGFHGASVSDPEFTTLLSGAGGGGGGGTDSTPGAGGGGGGGTVIIHAVGDVEIGTSPTSASGYIFASGGKGGDTASAASAPGGGGGGGSIQIFSGGTINIFNTDMQSSRALGGAGGGDPAPAGANGSDGRSWFASVGYNSTGTGSYSPSEEGPVAANNNTVEFTNTPQYVITRAVDLESTLASIDSLSSTPISADFAIELKGSSDNFLTDDTGWTSNLALVSQKRYLKMKVTVTTSNVSNPTMLDQVAVTYTPGQRKDFQFKTSGCGTLGGPTSPGNSGGALLLALLPLVALWALRRYRKHFSF